MSDLIRREDALEIVKRTSGDYATAFSEISKFPAVDAVEVVRCGECWHRFAGHFGMMCIGRPNDFFCANGERREENAAD